MSRPTMTDAETLAILDMRASDLSAGKIAKRIGRTKNVVVGLLWRIDRETEASPHDGTMADGWWRDGLARRAARTAAE